MHYFTRIFFLMVLLAESGMQSFSQKNNGALINLGEQINSVYAELRPVISANGSTLFFVVEGHPENFHFKDNEAAQDVWISTRDSISGQWTKALHPSGLINSGINNSIFWISSDGKRALIRVDANVAGGKSRGLAYCTVNKNDWTLLNKLNIPQLEKVSVGKYFGANLSVDENTLLLYGTSVIDGEINDLFVSFKNRNGSWSIPTSLGPEINDELTNEITPFLAADGVTLFFSSNRSGGIGDQDIWMSKRLDNSWQKWSQPINLGATINTKGWDAYLSLDANGDTAYLASQFDSKGKSDIVRVALPDSIRPVPMMILYGVVREAISGKVLSNSSIHLWNDQPLGRQKIKGITDSTGHYQLVVTSLPEYVIELNMPGYYKVADRLVSSEPNVIKNEIHRDYYLTPDTILTFLNQVQLSIREKENEINILKNKLANSNGGDKEIEDRTLDDSKKEEANISGINKSKVTAKNVEDGELADTNRKSNKNASTKNTTSNSGILFFETGKQYLKADELNSLTKIIEEARENTLLRIKIDGHTDSKGAKKLNWSLSKDRALAIYELFISAGIEPSRIEFYYWGDSKPRASNLVSEGMAQNRRVEISMF